MCLKDRLSVSALPDKTRTESADPDTGRTGIPCGSPAVADGTPKAHNSIAVMLDTRQIRFKKNTTINLVKCLCK